ncbi:MAG: hypothetical protein LBU88_00315 [Treponema sp.]|nr:hypothetical protein [Treponema sp.]
MKKIFVFMMVLALALAVVFNAAAAGVSGEPDTIQVMDTALIEAVFPCEIILPVVLFDSGMFAIDPDDDANGESTGTTEALTLRGTRTARAKKIV